MIAPSRGIAVNNKGPAGAQSSGPIVWSLRVPQKPPERSALASVARDDRSLALAPVETIVESQFDHLDVLINTESPGEGECRIP